MVCRTRWLAVGVACALAAAPVLWAQGVCAPDLDGNIAKQMYEPDAIYWQPEVEYEQMILRVEAPCDTIEKVFRKGETPFFELREVLGPLDGSYRWELRVEPVVDPEVREALTKARDTGDYSAVRKLQDQGKLPVGPFVEGESFSVVEGRIIPPEMGEEKAQLVSRSPSAATGLSTAIAVAGGSGAGRGEAAGLAPKDYVINDDLIVDGSACIGFDCVNGESFGFDTLRLKENNLRIGFDDTSTAASYPTNNWQIRANDSANGGASFLGFVDMGASGTSTGGDLVFAVEAGAPANALYVDDGGRVGFGTSTPSVELHTVDGDTPTLRFQQDGSSGFAPQTWDIAGNETNFFVRDVTNGSTLPFRIRPGAPSSSIFIDPDGNVGIGTSSPAASLHVKRSDGTVGLRVEETSSSVTGRDMMALVNNGGVRFLMNNTDLGLEWTFRTVGTGHFLINTTGASTNQFDLDDATGNLEIGGVLSENSSRSMKTDFESLDPVEVLDRLSGIEIPLWSYRNDPTGARHLGPMADDFYQAFGLGGDAERIALTDKAGVALAAIQGLQATVRNLVAEKDRQIEALQQRVDALEAQLAASSAEGSQRP